MRAAYAEATAAYLTADGKAVAKDGNVTVAAATGTDTKTQVVTVENVEIKSQKNNSWSNLAGELPFTAPDDPGAATTKIMTFTYTLGTSSNPTAAFTN